MQRKMEEADVDPSDQSDNSEDKILYDLNIYAEWPQEPETVSKPVKEKPQVSYTGKLTSAAQRSAWTFLRSVGVATGSDSPCLLPPGLTRLINTQLNWNLAVTTDGSTITAAILQDQTIELRSSRDEFDCVCAKWNVAKDLYPQWRRLEWSPTGDLLAYADSCGNVSVFDLLGAELCQIFSQSIPRPDAPADLSFATAGLIFKEHKLDENFTIDLLVINFQGTVRNYGIRYEGGCKLQHTFNFGSSYPLGVSSVVFLPSHDLLLVGGCGDTESTGSDKDVPNARQYGVMAWRVLSSIPHYKLVTDYEEDMKAAQGSRLKVVKKLTKFRWFSRGSEPRDGVFRLALSPNNKVLAVLHHSGRFTLLEVPSLRIRNTWPQELQPDHDAVNHVIGDNPKRRKEMKEQLSAFFLSDINWWSDQALILARGTGAITLSSAETMRNLLGNSPEWFEPAPLVTKANEGGFLSLECECKYSSLKRHLTKESESEEEYEDSDEDADATMVTRTTKYVRYALHYVTDNEKFAPPRKKPRLVSRTYRLLCLKSTTPEELYARKIDDEEYGEALQLAKAYGLDGDLVYQRQWRRTDVSVASIQDYLSKISKRHWVLHECLERVPDNIDAMRELLQFGLRGTDVEALISIGKKEDKGQFILSDRAELYEESIDPFDPEAEQKEKDRETKYVDALLEQVVFNNLNLEQKELCRARVKLLQYLDRLSTYQEILGGAHYAAERYNHVDFEKFRSQNIVEVATEKARICDWQALDTIITFHGDDLLPHRLAILSNFPETFPPREYSSLLPEIQEGAEGPAVMEWMQNSWRDDKDWCELPECHSAVDSFVVNPGAFLYDEQPEYEKYFSRQVIQSVVQVNEWYAQRAKEIEDLSRQVDLAIDLIDFGMSHNVEGLDQLKDDFLTLDTLVYECHLDDSITLAHLQKMPDIDKVHLMMSRSSVDMYIKNVHRWLLPFLRRLEQNTPGSFDENMQNYLVTMAETDLTLCLKMFEGSKADVSNPIISDQNQLMVLALQCIYASKSSNQLSTAFSILECLPQRGFGVVSEDATRLHNQVDELECHLIAAETFENNNVHLTISFIRDSQNNEEETKKLFTKVTRLAGHNKKQLTEKQWKALLLDLLTLQTKVFHCVDTGVCYEIFVESLLCSSRLENIKLAGKIIETSSQETVEPDYSTIEELGDGRQLEKLKYSQSVELVLRSAREYFDSSINMDDPCMDLAKACLDLISDHPDVIKERDLGEALVLLAGFGVTRLPLQVRMCKDKLDLIKESINAKQATYKKSQRLLKLGKLLNIEGNVEGKVLKLVAEAAIKNKDTRVAYETCCQLMETGYAEIWTECKMLAQMEEFHDIPAKAELLAFAVTYCSPEMIEAILHAKCILEMQLLYDKVQSQVADRDSQSPGESPFSARGAVQQTKDILSTTNRATRSVLSTVTDTKWWKKTLKSLQPLSKIGGERQHERDLNEEFTKQGCHPFYMSPLVHPAYRDTGEVDYDRYFSKASASSAQSFSEKMLRTGKLEETLTEGKSNQPVSKVLLQLTEEHIARDTTLGLAYLLALPNPEDAETCFQQLPRTFVSLQLALYYYALQLITELKPENQPEMKPAYMYDPTELTQKLLGHAQWRKAEGTKNTERVDKLLSRLLQSHELLMDYSQAQVLQGLNRGVDIGRFTIDAEYKRETILGLAMSSETEMFDIAMSLAQRYSIPLFDIYITHVEFLFESGLPTSDLEARLREKGFLPMLLQNKTELAKRMRTYVYATIDGKDHDRIQYYYRLLEGCDTGEKLTPQEHVKLIHKLSQVAPDIDYIQLMDGTKNPIEILRPVLDAKNITTLAKLAAKIPNPVGDFLNPSTVYSLWASHLFWGIDNKPADLAAEWIHRYEACGEHLAKMLPEDVQRFVDEVTFVPAATKQLTVDCRRQIVRRALKLGRQKAGATGGKKKKMEETAIGNRSWEEVIQHMQQSLEHLDHLSVPVVVSLRESADEQCNAYALEFDLSRSEPDKVKPLFLKMIAAGQSPQTVEDLCQAIASKSNVTWSSKQVIRDSVETLIKTLKSEPGLSSDEQSRIADRDCMADIKTIITQVSAHQRDGGRCVGQEDLLDLLRPFCADSSMAVQCRLDILGIMEESFTMSENDLVLLILFRTQAVVLTAWPEKHLTAETICSDETRQVLFTSLLEDSNDLKQFQALVNLLKVWPILSSVESQAERPEYMPWCQLISCMVQHCHASSNDDVVKLISSLQKENNPHRLSESCIQYVIDMLTAEHMNVTAIKCALVSDINSFYDVAAALLQSQEKDAIDYTEDDDDLLNLILKCHLSTQVVSTVHFASLVNHILANQAATEEETPYYLRVETVANQLRDSGFDAEAGALMTQHNRLHPALRTFDAALGFLSRWMPR